MRSFAPLLLAVATAIVGAVAQYNDGYETVNSATDPVQIRLAYQGPTAMMVSWNTFSQLTNPTVSYGISPNALILTASSSVSVTYATSLTYNNHVNITGLLPYTTYYYLPQYSNATNPYTFTTARLAGDPTPYTMGVVVDMGTFGALGLSQVVGTGAAHPLTVNEQTTIAALQEMIDNYEFMVHAGDIAYADYWLKEEIQNYLPTTTTTQGAQVYESILNAFYDELLPISSQKAYMVNAGNHEANCDNGGTTNKTSGVAYTESICLPGQTNFTGFINHWRMPSGPSGGQGNFWYSYDYGMTHFVHIDTETDLGNGLVGPDEGSPEYGGPFGTTNQQINWLTNDLASVNRAVTPWIVVFGHRGWYLSASGSVCANCQTAFESLFHTYDVDLYINGHAHLYERTAPIYKGVIDPNGLNNPSSTLYITNGAAGHYDGLDTFTTIQPYSVYHEASDYAWTTISFTNATHITVSTLWSANNTVFDAAILYKAHVYSSGSSSASFSTTSSSSSISSSTAISSTSILPTTTTNIATTTSTAVYPTYTNFNGQGHLYVYTGGLLEGDIGSAGTWYNTPGQNTATYTAVPLYSNGTAFLLQHSSDYCTIGSDYSFGCAVTASSGATIFGQTADGNLTYNGSPAFYASSAASSGVKPTVYATPLAVSLNIVWGGTATSSTTAASSTSTSTISSTSAAVTSSSTTAASSTSTSTISSTTTAATTSSTTAASATSTSISSTTTAVTSSSTIVASSTSTSIISSTTTAGTSSSTTSTTTSGTITSTIVQLATISSTAYDTETATDTATITATDTDTATATITDTITATATDTATATTTETVLATTSETLTDLFTMSLTVTDSDWVTITQTATDKVTETDSVTIVQTDTETGFVTITQGTTVTETNSPVTVTSTHSASTVTVTKPASTVTITQPASTISIPTTTITKHITSVVTLTDIDTIIRTEISRARTVSVVTITRVVYTEVLSTSTITKFLTDTVTAIITSSTTKFRVV